MIYNWVLVILGLIAILAELFVGVSTGFDLVLLGSALIIGGIVGNLIASWQLGVITAVILSLSYIFLGRKLIKSKLIIHSSKTNVDLLIGDKAVVTKAINRVSTGQVRVGTELWRANSQSDLKVGDSVKIESVDGVTLKVLKSD